MLMSVESLFIIVSCLLTSGFFTLFERKVMASVQTREGPNKVYMLGFFQPMADAMKLFFKTNVSNESAMEFMFFFSPLTSFFISLMCWTVFPVVWGSFSWIMSMLFILVCFSLSVYGVMVSGWFSRSKYASLGCIRSLSQSVSYEIPLSTIIVGMMIVFSCISLKMINLLQFLCIFAMPFLPLFVIMVIVLLAEMNRSPFDLAEGESELVSGFSIEMGSSVFVMVFLSEYLSLVWCCILVSVLFIGMTNHYLGLKSIVVMLLLIWIRCSFPRIRYDHVMSSCWVLILPLIFSFLFMNFSMMFNQSQMEAYYC